MFGALCVFSGFLNLFLNPDIGQEGRIRLLCNVEGQYCQKERKERKRENGLANTSILSDILVPVSLLYRIPSQSKTVASNNTGSQRWAVRGIEKVYGTTQSRRNDCPGDV